MLETIDRLSAHKVKNGPARGLRIVRGDRCSGFASGDYERPVQDALQATLREGDVLVDVGANVGFFTLLGARLVGEQGAVHAFEPIPANVSVIRRNLAVNGLRNVTVVSKAVADSAGTDSIWVTDHPGGATLMSTGEVPYDARTQIEIERTTLDQWVEQAGVHAIRMIKVDAEGAELAVLRGMPFLIGRFRPILLIELDDVSKEGLQRKVDGVHEWCGSVGYQADKMTDSYANADYQVAHLLARAI